VVVGRVLFHRHSLRAGIEAAARWRELVGAHVRHDHVMLKFQYLGRGEMAVEGGHGVMVIRHGQVIVALWGVCGHTHLEIVEVSVNAKADSQKRSEPPENVYNM
jgi:hypothetical protein